MFKFQIQNNFAEILLLLLNIPHICERDVSDIKALSPGSDATAGPFSASKLIDGLLYVGDTPLALKKKKR